MCVITAAEIDPGESGNTGLMSDRILAPQNILSCSPMTSVALAVIATHPPMLNISESLATNRETNSAENPWGLSRSIASCTSRARSSGVLSFASLNRYKANIVRENDFRSVGLIRVIFFESWPDRSRSFGSADLRALTNSENESCGRSAICRNTSYSERGMFILAMSSWTLQIYGISVNGVACFGNERIATPPSDRMET